jgi:hypothetical protein
MRKLVFGRFGNLYSLRYEAALRPVRSATGPSVAAVTITRNANLGVMAGIFVPAPKKSRYAKGYNLQSPQAPPSLWVKEGWLGLSRDAKSSFKIGSDSTSLIWIGERYSVRIDIPRIPGAEFPDDGSSAEVYTNPDPAAYIELETLEPLKSLAAGDRLSNTNTYLLARRIEKNPQIEARRMLSFSPR